MKAQFFLPSVDGNLIEGKPPINVKFEIPYFTTSGIQVAKVNPLSYFLCELNVKSHVITSKLSLLGEVSEDH